jgi:hypothetical protein
MCLVLNMLVIEKLMLSKYNDGDEIQFCHCTLPENKAVQRYEIHIPCYRINFMNHNT